MTERFKELKMNDIAPGDKLVADSGFTCISPHATREVFVSDTDGNSLFVKCEEGEHLLEGQRDEHGFCIGFKKATDKSTGEKKDG